MSDRDLTFLEFKDSDDAGMRAMKSYWQLAMAMPVDERRYFFQEERVKEEENYLLWMIDSQNYDAWFVAEASRRARSAVLDYDMLKDEASLTVAELWTEIAQSTKENRFTIADIRKQREKIQWEKKKLREMTKPPTEPSPSSSHLES